MGVKLSDLSTETSPASSDIMMIADPATGIAKKITVSALKTFLDSLGGGGSTQLSTPGSFTATVASSTQINLSWTDVANESSYLLEWSANGTSGWTQIGGTIAAGSTSYNHTGLTASTQYYYRLKAVGNGTTYTDSNYATANGTTSAGGYQPESTAFFAVNTGYSTPTKDAIDAFVISVKSIGWSKFSQILINAGTTAAEHRVNLINPSQLATFSGTSHSANGVQLTSGSPSQYVDSDINYNTLSSNSLHFGFHIRASSVNSEHGIWDSTGSYGLWVRTRNGSDQAYVAQNDLNIAIGGSQTSTTGHFVLCRESSTALKFYRNGSQILSTVTTPNTGPMPSGPLFYGAINHLGTGAIAGGIEEYTVLHFGAALTASEIATLNTAITTLNTALGR